MMPEPLSRSAHAAGAAYSATIEWQWSPFDLLTRNDLYAVLDARQQVFVLEQNCLYQDIDGLDQQACHLLGWQQQDGARTLAAYLRCFEPGIKYSEASLGRVLTVAAARGQGIGKALMEQGLRHIELHFPGQPIRISAQQYLERFYRNFGFTVVSAPYSEDGIPHIQMLRELPTVTLPKDGQP